MKRAIVTGDYQIPFQDDQAMAAMRAYVVDQQPDLFLVGGDALDFPYLTTKFIRKSADPRDLTRDIRKLRGFLLGIRNDCPDTDIVMVEGNHEARLRNLILERAQALEDFLEEGGPLDVETLIDPHDDIDMLYVGPYDSVYHWQGLIFKHGEATGQYPAARELRTEGSSGVSFHTHRFDMAIRTDRSGEHAWWSMGCLCNTSGKNRPPSYHKGYNRLENWQQGFGVIDVADDGLFSIKPVVIINGRFVSPEGQVYGPKGAL